MQLAGYIVALCVMQLAGYIVALCVMQLAGYIVALCVMQLAGYIVALPERSAVSSNWRYIGTGIRVELSFQMYCVILQNTLDYMQNSVENRICCFTLIFCTVMHGTTKLACGEA